MEPSPASKPLCVFKKMGDRQSQKNRGLCQLALVMLHSLFCWHKTIWRSRLSLGSIWSIQSNPFGVARFSNSYANLRWPHIFKNQIWGKSPVLHLSKCGNYYPIYNWYCLRDVVSCSVRTAATLSLRQSAVWSKIMLVFHLQQIAT